MEDKYKRGKELIKLKGIYINNEDSVDEMNELLTNLSYLTIIINQAIYLN